MQQALRIHQLTKTYPPTKKGGQPFTAVDHISFQVQPGEVVGLLGPNGAGKSTTIYMLLGVLTPTSGEIVYFNKDFSQHRSETLQHVTFASTYIKMPWRLSVMENLRIYAYLYGLSKDQFSSRSKKFLTRFGVWDQRNKNMRELSAGQITRVMLAKAFIPHPKIALLDEPTASLDPEISHQIRGFVKEQQQEYGTTMIYTSHNMDEVTDVCDRVIFLKGGQIIAQDTPENLAQSTNQVIIRLFINSTNSKKLKQLKLKHKTIFVSGQVQITLNQNQISQLLQQLAKEKISYTRIEIDKPSLEDYFLKLSGVGE